MEITELQELAKSSDYSSFHTLSDELDDMPTPIPAQTSSSNQVEEFCVSLCNNGEINIDRTTRCGYLEAKMAAASYLHKSDKSTHKELLENVCKEFSDFVCSYINNDGICNDNPGEDESLHQRLLGLSALYRGLNYMDSLEELPSESAEDLDHRLFMSALQLRPYLLLEKPYLENEQPYELRGDEAAIDYLNEVHKRFSFSITWAKRASKILDPNFEMLLERRVLSGNQAELSFRRMQLAREVLEEQKKEHPEIISLSIFGSTVKGVATEKSDIDGFILVDVPNAQITDIRNASGELDYLPIFREQTLEQVLLIGSFASALCNKLGLKPNELDDLHALPLNINLVEEVTSEYIRIFNETLQIDPAYEAYIEAIFDFSLSRDVIPYRRAVLEEFKANGKPGEKAWEVMMRYLKNWELGVPELPKMFTDNRFYPRTIDEAIKILAS